MPQHAPDHELKTRFRDGDHTAFTEIYRRHRSVLTGAAYALLGDADLAAEAVQQAFVRAWRAAPGFDPARDLRPWLYAILRRAAFDTYRHSGRSLAIAMPEQELPPATAVQFEDSWLAWQVNRAVQELPSDERAVVRLSYRGSLSHTEIGERLGIPLGTVKSRMSRARRKLAVALIHIR